jgi:hypothetical protein
VYCEDIRSPLINVSLERHQRSAASAKRQSQTPSLLNSDVPQRDKELRRLNSHRSKIADIRQALVVMLWLAIYIEIQDTMIDASSQVFHAVFIQ